MPSKKFLLVNPWIADIAAYNFWFRPIGLYRLSEWLSRRGAKSVLLDCLSPAKAPGKFPRHAVAMPECLNNLGIRRRFARYGIDTKEFDARLRALLPVDAVLVSSTISYWYPGIQWTVERIKTIIPEVPVILGGVYPTLWPAHASRHSGANLIFSGSLEKNAKRLASALDLPEQPVNPPVPWYKADMHDHADYSAIRTAEGCPFNCAYCASLIVSGTFRPRKSRDILREILALLDLGIKQISFYDDALLVDFRQRLGPVLEQLLHINKEKPVFHTPNAMHARLIHQDNARLMRAARFRTIRMGLETVNPARQGETGGKVVSDHVERAVRYLVNAGYNPGDIGIYLLAGLPGQPLREIEESIKFIRGLGARPYISEFSPIPGTVAWEQLKREGIVSDNTDPLLTNNSLFYRWSGCYDHHEFQRVKAMCSQNI